MEPLQIIISAIDEASEQIQNIATSLSEISDAAEAAVSDSNASLDTLGTGASSTIDSNISAINAQLDTIAASAQEAQDAATSDLDLIGAGSGSDIEANLAPAKTAISGIVNSTAQIGGMMTAVGSIANDIAAPITSFTNAGITGATEWQAQLTTLNSLLSNQAAGVGATAVPVKDLTDKIEKLNAENAKLASTSSGSTQTLAANQSTIQSNIDTIAQLTDQLHTQAAAQSMVGANVQNLTGQFTSAAQGVAKYGFTQQDAMSALTTLQAQTHSVTDTMSDYSVVVDLAAYKHETLTEAVQQMAGAFTGRGMAIEQATGVTVKDGLASQQAFQAVAAVVSGSATKSLNDYGTQTAALSANTNNLQTTALTPLLTTLDDIATKVDDVITKITNWMNAHQQLTKEIAEFLVIFGGFLSIVGTLATTFGPVILILGLFGVSLAVSLGWIALFVIGIALLIAIGVLIYNNWDSIMGRLEIIFHNMLDSFQAVWETLKSWWHDFIAGIESWFFGELKSIQDHWNDMLTGISNFAKNIWATIVNDAKTGVNDFINIINGMINAIDSIKINIPAITIPGTKMGTPAIDLGFNIPDIPLLAQGGIVVGPTLAMIGEGGPEAVIPLSSGTSGYTQGQPINIYIQGGSYLDKQGADQIAQALATKIQRQLKLTSFR